MASTYFVLRGIEPPELKRQPDYVRLMYYSWVRDLGLRRKDWELARGLNAAGEPLPRIAVATRLRRRSEMTPSGKGDPGAPYLMPGRALSRVRSLLAGKAHTTYAEFWWRFDSHTGDQYGKILAAHAKRGKAYDVVGLSPGGKAWVAAQAMRRWRQWLAGRPVEPATLATQAAAKRGDVVLPSLLVGRTDLTYAEGGIGATVKQAQKAIDEGRSSGFMGADEWIRYFRSSTAPLPRTAGASVSVQRGRSSVILDHTWSRPMDVIKQQLETAINNLVAALDAGYDMAQLEGLLGEMFDQALGEAVRRKLVKITKDGDGKPKLRVVKE